MSEQAQPSTVSGSETVDNSVPSSLPTWNEIAQEGAEYLQSCGLTVPYESVSQPWMLDEPSKLVDPSDDDTSLTRSDGLSEAVIPSTVSAPEKWEIPGKSLAFLQRVCNKQSDAEAEGDMREIRKRAEASSIRKMKLELPALRSDHEIDLRKYKRRMAAAGVVKLADDHFFLEPCDEEKDEGLEFPSRAHNADSRIVQSVEQEKLEVSKHSFEMLMKYLSSDWTAADQEVMLKSQIKYRGLVSREPITPPLTPRLEVEEPFVPDEATCAIPPASDPSSVLSDELKQAEDRIFSDDQLVVSSFKMEQADDIDDTALLLLPNPVQKLDNLKVEEPLLPAVDEKAIGPVPGSAEVRQDMPLDETKADDLQCQDADDSLAEALKDKAASMMMEIEQEKLEPLDATIRVDVPVLDFSIPEPEWCKLGGDAMAIFKSIPRESGVDFTSTRWTRQHIEESKMRWGFWSSRNPLPEVEEPITDTGLLVALLDLPADATILTSFDFVRKRSGLAILTEKDFDDEELQPLVPPSQSGLPQGDWLTLLKKRKSAHDGDGTKKKPKSDSILQGRRNTHHHGSTGQLLIQDEGAAAALLDNYLEMHAPKKKTVDQSPFFKKLEPPSAHERLSAEKNRSGKRRPRDDSEKTTKQLDEPQLRHGMSMICPEIPRLEQPLQMVMAVSVPRVMIKHLERLLPGLQLIDRDYSAHNGFEWKAGSVSRTEVISPLADEADLIPSPSTGIVLTTLIKIRQKDVPGSTRKTPHFTTRIESIAVRYERLIMLVSEDNKLDESMNPMSASDAAAFTSFQAFAATLPTETMVLYVGGGQETLAKWTAAIAARYAVGSHQLQGHLREDETQWELFLRRAGMNAYAAQVVLGMLSVPSGEPLINQQRAFGLPAFVKMPQEERLAMFQAVLGRGRVLARVGSVVDTDWRGVVGGMA